MKNFALIRNDRVGDMVVSDEQAFIDAISPMWHHVEPLTEGQARVVQIGWGWVAGQFVEPPPVGPEIDMRPEIEIKAIVSDNPDNLRVVRLDDGRWDVTCREGDTLTVTAALEVAGTKLGISDEFRMPMQARGSGRTIVLWAEMKDGVITIPARMGESEIWEVLEAAINEALTIEAQMRFDGLTIQAVQAV